MEPETNYTHNTNKSKFYPIRATNVPFEFFENRDVAKKYFRTFGKVKLIMFRPKRNSIIAEYANEEGMLNALDVGGEFNGKTFKVTRDYESPIKKKKEKRDSDPDWTDDPEIKAELEAMRGTIGITRTYNLRPEVMAVDPVEQPQLLKTKYKWKSSSPKLQKKKVPEAKITVGLVTELEEDLLNIIKQQALSIEDKFRILDARDKLIRIRLKKSMELSKITPTVGTCSDMCPEKERLMRETQHQVALYEQEENGKGMNPKLAIKQYSRSSADQEAPLSQELRPVSVLQMTMSYLMHRIMGLCDNSDVNLAEWYHFLWDRTRGIRKDITQQELCCQGSVELVEQCARFHIFCSARLVAEDPSVFDQKINTENLTKCLQTLKYMYHDLYLKGESCRNEPEFRGYIILLNLNDGNFMWEVQQLQKHIQESREVQFALDVYSCLDKNNYVKFFKLVQSTTYLNACILMRYFIQVRLSALKTVLKCYSPRVSETSLPISYLRKILSFENEEAAIEFLETYGLYTNVERSRIILNKQSFSLPEFPYVLDRAINLIESKRNTSIGEVVCGKQLPPKQFENHIPQDSFNEKGFLVDLPSLDEPNKREEPPKIEEKPKLNIFAPKQNIFVQKKLFETETTTPVNIFGPSKPTPIFGDMYSKPNMFGGEVVPLPEFSPVTPELKLPSPSKIEEIQRKQKEEEEEERRKQQQQREEEMRKKLEEKRKLMEEEIRKRIEEEKRREQQLLQAKKAEEERQQRRLEAERRRRQFEMIEREKQKAIEIRRDVSELLQDLIVSVEDKIIEEKLAEITKKTQERRIKKITIKWKEITRRKRKRKALDFNPMWCPARTLEDEADELYTTSQDLTLSSIKRYKLGQPFEIPVEDKLNMNRINLNDLVFKFLAKKSFELNLKVHNEIFYKITFSVPSETEFKYGLNHVESVLDNYIQWKDKSCGKVLIQQSLSHPTATYCLEKQKGIVIPSKSDSNGLIFIADQFNEILYRRILKNLQNYGLHTKIPVVVALQSYETDELQRKLQLLKRERLIFDYLLIIDKFTTRNLINIVEEAIIFLSTKIEQTPPLMMDSLKALLANYVGGELWRRTNGFAKWNHNFKECLKEPNIVIHLYNESIDRLKLILVDESCGEYQKFPEIFKQFLRNDIPDCLPCDYKYFPSFWDSPVYLQHIKTVLESLKITNFLGNWPPSRQEELEEDIQYYCVNTLKLSDRTFYRVMSLLLRPVDVSQDFSDVRNVLWSDIIEMIANEKLNQVDFSLYGTGFVNKSIYNQLMVVYNVDSLDNFIKSDWFYLENPIIKTKIFQLLEDEKKHKKEVQLLDNTMNCEYLSGDVDKLFERVFQQPKDNSFKLYQNELNNHEILLNDVEDALTIHKKILEKSGDFLTRIIEVD